MRRSGIIRRAPQEQCVAAVGGRVYKALSLKGHSVPYTLYRSPRRLVGVQMSHHSEGAKRHSPSAIFFTQLDSNTSKGSSDFSNARSVVKCKRLRLTSSLAKEMDV